MSRAGLVPEGRQSSGGPTGGEIGRRVTKDPELRTAERPRPTAAGSSPRAIPNESLAESPVNKTGSLPAPPFFATLVSIL